MRTVFALATLVLFCLVGQVHAEEPPPNIVFILVDDMGYSDIGCYGGEVQTPNLDRLAQNGLRFTSMYNTSKCFPSRACLLTGVYAQQCGMGRSARGIRNAMTMADLLRAQGYRTLAVGKHHSNQSLFDRGFDRFHGFHYGQGKSCANHFNPGQQRVDEGVPARKQGESRTYCFDNQKMIPYYTPKEKDWYTTDYFTKWAIEFLDEYKHEDKPYFLYVSYTAPHDPLHAWPKDIAKYSGVYEAGYEVIRAERFSRQRQMNLFGLDSQLSAPTHRSWDSLTAADKRDQARRMQVYAAMIDCVDQNIGKLLAKIEEMGELDNTLIMFASDNGSSAANVDAGTGEVGSLTRWASLQKDWANVSNTPFRYWKSLSHEGGICTPFIAHWPNVITKKGSINRQPVHFVDVMSTVREITNADYPERFNGSSITPLQGESLLPAFESGILPPREAPIFFEYAKGGAVRDGKWKLVTNKLPTAKNKSRQKIQWELYDLSNDITETTNVATQHPEVVEHLRKQWQAWYANVYGG